MWMRLLAMTRRPESSSILVTAPVRLRRVASGLMIEKVRVAAIGLSSKEGGRFARAPSGGRPGAQGLGFLDPLALFLGVVAALDVVAAVELAPHAARGLRPGFAEQQEHALERVCLVAPVTVGEDH